MVITVKCDDMEIKRVLIGQGKLTYILYYDAFERLRLDLNSLKAFHGSLIGFCDEQVQIKGYTTLKTIFGAKESAILIKVTYLVIIAPSLYNMVIRLHAFNHLGVALCTLYICMKYREWTLSKGSRDH